MPAAPADDDAGGVLQALQALQDALAAAGPAADSQAQLQALLGRLAAGVHDVLQRAALLQQEADSARGAAQALRRQLASRDAEAARLQSEIRWLRASVAAAAAAAAGSDADTAAATTEPAARQALLTSAVAARDKPGAAVTQLQSHVDACRERIAALESELSLVAASSSTRLAEAQEAFAAKLERVRQVHAQQLAATQAQLEQQQARCGQLEQQLADAVQQEQRQQELLASLQQQVLQALQREQPGGSGIGNASSSCAVPASRCCQRAGEQQQGTSAAAARVSAAAADEDASVLRVMEAQLARLSALLRAQQAEAAQLRQLLTDGCDERRQLQQQLAAAAAQRAPAAPAAAGKQRKPAACR